MSSALRLANIRLIGAEDESGRRRPIGTSLITIDKFPPRIVFVNGDCFVLFANLSRGDATPSLIYAQERPFYADSNFRPDGVGK